MVAGHCKHFVPGRLQPFEEAAGLAELLGPRALREVAADDDEVGLELIDALLNRADELIVMGAEVQVGQMNEASHEA
jgi:hypothetical protein